MDPVTQGFTGALFAQSVARPSRLPLAFGVGFLAGVLADLDILIRSSQDPLLVIEYHRHFTHALLFAPIGAALSSLLIWRWVRSRAGFATIYGFSLLGFVSHGILDMFTAYGTQWLWPLSDARISLGAVSIIDPLFSGPVAILLILAVWRKRRVLWKLAAIYAVAFMSLAVYQKSRVTDVQAMLAEQRGHQVQRSFSQPAIGNQWLWRSVYRYQDRYYIDALRVGWFSEPQVYPGGSVARFQTRPGDRQTGSQQARDLQRFRRFTLGFLGEFPALTDVAGQRFIGDVRYGVLPNHTQPLWGIQLVDGSPDQHIRMRQTGLVEDNSGRQLWQMLIGDGGEPIATD